MFETSVPQSRIYTVHVLLDLIQLVISIPACLDQHQLAKDTTTCGDGQQMRQHELVIFYNDIHQHPHLNHNLIIFENIPPTKMTRIFDVYVKIGITSISPTQKPCHL